MFRIDSILPLCIPARRRKGYIVVRRGRRGVRTAGIEIKGKRVRERERKEKGVGVTRNGGVIRTMYGYVRVIVWRKSRVTADYCDDDDEDDDNDDEEFTRGISSLPPPPPLLPVRQYFSCRLFDARFLHLFLSFNTRYLSDTIRIPSRSAPPSLNYSLVRSSTHPPIATIATILIIHRVSDLTRLVSSNLA